MFDMSSHLYIPHNVIVQLEEKCFVQQTMKIANYEDDLMKERTRAEGNEEQLKKTMNKVCWTNSPMCVCVYEFVSVCVCVCVYYYTSGFF